jgi:UDP-N-acetylmuramoyl-tripeptide--D-alanyl-D-alanine ligase
MSDRLRSRRAGTVWNDSRKVQPGDVFVAIETDTDDGHRYVGAALKAGALAAIVAKSKAAEFTKEQQKKLIVVSDTVKALQRMAARYRTEMGLLMIGITGSSGKTTTRSFISSVLRTGMNIGETYTNWNNHIGVPQSILRFKGEEWAGVIEMGANHAGEIHELSMIAHPDIAVITNIGYAHVGLFGSLTNTTKAKFEIADGLNSENGFLLLNGDDPRLVKGARECGLKAYFFGMSANATIRAENVNVDPVQGVSFTVDKQRFVVSMPGRHFVYSALPAIFIGRRCGIRDQKIAQALASQKPVSMRGTVEKKNGVNFIVDCYNANPSSMESAIVYLTDLCEPKYRVAVVGDMLELGTYAKRLHTELGRRLADAKVKKVIAVGSFAKTVVDGAKKAGMSAKSLFTVDTSENAVAVVKDQVREGDMVLLKGSRGVHLEVVFERF